MKRILIATDFSRDATRAQQYGVELARLFGADIELFTSYSESSLALGEQDMALSAEFLERAKDQTRAHLDEVAGQLRSDGFTVDYTLGTGAPAAAICDRVDAGAFDLLVLGTRGTHGFDHTMLGSVSERTARAAACPVLSACGDAPEPAGIRRILVATDFSPHADAALEWSRQLAERAGAAIALLHSVPLPFGVGEEELAVEDDHTANEIAKSRTRLEEIASRIGPGVEVMVGRRHPDTDALAQAEAWGADLIVVGTRGRRGLPHVVLGSTTVRLMRRAQIPVVSVKRDA